jgi:hypothetical protein
MICETLSQKKPFIEKGLVEWLKVQALSSNSSTTKKKKRKNLGFVPVLLGICFEPLAVSSFVPYGVGLGVSERSLLALKH